LDEPRPVRYAILGASPHRVRTLWAGVFVSGLVVTDLLLKPLCSAWPFMMYLGLGLLGAGLGPRLHARFLGEGFGFTLAQMGIQCLALLSAVGMLMLVVLPVGWESKCAWRHCDRALGPGLLNSPFPVGTPNCGGWNRCVNEYPYSRTDYQTALQHLRAQGCPEP